jgi:hypothetical protein
VTDEQRYVATFAITPHCRTFPVEFRRDLIEDLPSAGIPDSAVDVIISNCAVNLIANKQGPSGK